MYSAAATERMNIMDAKQIEKQLAQMWATRPVRPASPRTIAGVCTGIGDRYRVDPTLVKVAFVVSALFGGSGVLLYLVAWVALPSHRSAVTRARTGRPAGRRRRSHGWHGHGNPKLVLLIVAAVIVLTSFGPNRTWGSGALLGGVLMLFGWWLLYQRTPTPPPGTSVDTVSPGPLDASGQFERWVPRAALGGGGYPTAPRGVAPAAPQAVPAAASAPTVDLLKSAPDTAAPRAETVGGIPDADRATQVAALGDSGDAASARLLGTDQLPPAWDPLGAARFAWDLPEPSSTQPPAPARRRRPLTLIVLGAAILVAAGGAAANRAGADWFTAAHVLSLALAVVGAGLIVASVLRRRSGEHTAGGLVPVAVILAVSVIVTTAAMSGSAVRDRFMPAGGMGERNEKPLSENDIRPEYSVGVGSLNLDLREVSLTGNRQVQLRTGVGEVVVQVPPTMNVRAECSTGIGETRCPEGVSGGTDGTQGPTLTINAHTGMGQVQVTR